MRPQSDKTNTHAPNLFLIGAPRSGTTTLYYHLRNHPQIFFPELKEPHFFGTDLGLKAGGYKTCISSYRELFLKAVSTFQHRGDASVFYLYSKEAPANIHFFNPDAKILAILRQPVDMMYSMFSFSLRHGAEVINDFEKALDAEPTRKQGKRIPKSVFIEESLFYRDISNYSPQLKRYYDLFPKEQIRVYLFEDLKENAEWLFQDLADFLGIENEFKQMSFHVNKTEDVQFDASRVLNRKYPEAMALARKLLPENVRKWLQFIKGIERSPKEPAPLSPALRQKLTLEKKDEILALSQLINRNLDHWLV